jgi:hypothetical protein
MAAAFLALFVIAMLMLSGLRLELQYRRGLKVGGAATTEAGAVQLPAVARPSLRKVPDPYSY